MSEKLTVEKPKGDTGPTPESPRTAHDPNFDDDEHDQADSSAAPAGQPSQEEVPPPKPPRPMSPQARAETTLIEAFPNTEPSVVKAVLVASGGKLEPAFNALLSMTDPNYKDEEAPPPPQPPRPAQQGGPSQLERDEEYARQLAAHYNSAGYGGSERGPPLPRRPQETGLKPNELYDDREHSFLDDDLPVFQESIKKTFNETKTKFNSWISDIQKKFDGDEDEDLYADRPGGSQQQQQRQNFGPSQSEQLYGIRKSAERTRRSGDRERYDADPQVIGDDFTKLHLRDDEATSPQERSTRPLANPNLFKPTPSAPQGGPVDEVDAVAPPNRQPSPSQGKTKKWQPLTSVAPNPESEDNDPFSLGDSDDDEAKKTDLKAEDTERLKRKASVSEKEPEGTGKLEPAERSGSMDTRDKVAEEILAGTTDKSE